MHADRFHTPPRFVKIIFPWEFFPQFPGARITPLLLFINNVLRRVLTAVAKVHEE